MLIMSMSKMVCELLGPQRILGCNRLRRRSQSTREALEGDCHMESFAEKGNGTHIYILIDYHRNRSLHINNWSMGGITGGEDDFADESVEVIWKERKRS